MESVLVMIILALAAGNIVQENQKYDHCKRWEFKDEMCRVYIESKNK